MLSQVKSRKLLSFFYIIINISREKMIVVKDCNCGINQKKTSFSFVKVITCTAIFSLSLCRDSYLHCRDYKL